MKNWLAGLSFWPLMTYAWSAFFMFYALAALGGFADRLGLGS